MSSAPVIYDRRGFFTRVATGAAVGAAARAARGTLAPASALYALCVGARNRLFDLGALPVRRLPGPTISVGNLSVGGTGKTPLAGWIAQRLVEMGRRPAILSRGYGAGPARGGDVNDEAAMLAAQQADVVQECGPDRLLAAERAVFRHGADCFVLDDGFQHRRAGRDLDIVVVDAFAPARAERLLPAGALREPFSSLRRADTVVLTRADLADADRLDSLRRRAKAVAPGVCVVLAAHRPEALLAPRAGLRAEPSDVAGRAVFAFCGVGNPESFVATIERLSAEVRAACFFPDHHEYTVMDCREVLDLAGGHRADTVVTTQKDAVKALPIWPDESLHVLSVRMAWIEGEDALLQQIRASVAGGNGGERDEDPA